ncbi:MAG: hypothetical protein IPN92_01875 [Chromatiaceae bacterium]|nr:hypothetical protein [Chromatiaceae bacterium]
MNSSLPRRWLVSVLDPDRREAPDAIAGENRRPREDQGLNLSPPDLAQGLKSCF